MSDIHANHAALVACIAHAQTQHVSQWVFLGDYVGYGPCPCEVIDTIQSMVDAGAVALLGNHDEMALTPLSTEQSNSWGGLTAAWTAQQLSDTHKDFLRALPLQHQIDSLLFTHASARDPSKWRYVDDERAANLCADATDETVSHVFVGHVHFQHLYYKGANARMMQFVPKIGVAVPTPRHRKWVATIGSVGQPRDGDTRAMYAIFDTKTWSITYHRVAYAVAQTTAALRAAGLPEVLAERLETGR